MLRKILWILLVIIAGIGLLLCVGGLIGAWFVNAPVTNAVTSTTEVAKSYLALASNTTVVASDQLEELRSQLDAIGARVGGMDAETRATVVGEATTTFQDRFGPTLGTMRTTLAALRTGAIALNQSLESANRIPGVNVPTFTEQLQAVDARIDSIDTRFNEIKTSLSDVSIDGDRLQAMIAAASDEVVSVEELVNQWNGQIAAIDAGITRAGAAAPGLIDTTTIVLSLLLILFGAGQLCLVIRGVQALRS